MWNLKTKVIPAIIRATGIISKSFRKYQNNIFGKSDIQEMQKTVILVAAHMLQK